MPLISLARTSSEALPLSVRAVLLMVTGCLLFSIMGALVKLLGQRLDSFQIAFFRCFFGFIAFLPFVLLKKGRRAFRTTHFYGHFLRAAIGVAAIIAGFYATTRLPLTDSTAISFTAPLFMILTSIFLLGEKVRWRRGLATVAGFIGVLVMVRPDSGTLDVAAMVGLFAAFLAALSTTLIKRLSTTEAALTILVYFGLFSSILTAIPAYFVWHPLTGDDFAQLALVGALGAVGQFCQVRAYATGELMAVPPIDYSRRVFAGSWGSCCLPNCQTDTRWWAPRLSSDRRSISPIAKCICRVRTVPCSRYGRSLRTRRTPMRRNLVRTRPPVTRSARRRRHRCAVERHPVFWRVLPRRRSALRSKGRKQAALFSRHHCVS
jgi:drug/metabolite transporter (DMT)-like permease